MLKVLLVTDDSILERMLMVTLTINGLSVTSVSHLSDLTALLKKDHYHALLLDTEYEELSHALRDKGFNVPILIFSDCSIQNIVENIHYLSKPFLFTDLKAKMNNMFRARFQVKEDLIINGNLKIDVTHEVVTIKDKMINLGKMELAILVSLARRTGRIVSKEKLRMDLEAQGQFFNTTIQHHIKELKRKLKDVSGEKLQIKVITGVGYQLLNV